MMNLINNFQDQFGVALTMTGLHSIWMGVLLVALVSILIRCEIVKGARSIYALHLASLGVLLIGSLICFNWYYQPSAPTYLVGNETLNLIQQTKTSAGVNISLPYVFSLIWVLGILTGIMRILMGYMKLNRLRARSYAVDQKWLDVFDKLIDRMKVSHHVQLRLSKFISIPMVVGHFKPVVLVPISYFSQLSTSEVECILVHELAHIKRYDYFVNYLQCLAETLLFFNPATWWFNRQIRKYREYCCDDDVYRYVRNKQSYVKALYKVADHYQNGYPLSIALSNSKSDLVMRIKRILNVSTDKRNFISFWKPILISVVVFSFFAFQIDQNQKAKEEIEPIASEMNATMNLEPLAENPLGSISEIASVMPTTGQLASIDPIRTATIETIDPIVQPEHLTRIEPLALIAPIQIVSFALDTSKRSKKARKLERQMEKKAKELEKLSEKWEHEVGDSYEFKAEEMEALSKKLNQAFEFEFQDVEWDTEDFEKRMEKMTQELEKKLTLNQESWNKFELDDKEFEEKMEKFGEELSEKYGNHTNSKEWTTEEKERFDKMMRDFGENFNQQFQMDFGEGNFEWDMSEFQGELNDVLKSLDINTENLNKQLTDQMQYLNESIKNLNFEFDFDNMNSELKETMEELQKLARELQEEVED